MKLPHCLSAFLFFMTGSLLPPSNASAEEAGFRHVVCFAYKESTTPADIAKITEEFVALKGKIDTIVSIEWGTSDNIEPLNDGFTQCFVVSFRDKAGLASYLPHPAHEAFVALAKPHFAKVFVFDFVPGK